MKQRFDPAWGIRLTDTISESQEQSVNHILGENSWFYRSDRNGAVSIGIAYEPTEQQSVLLSLAVNIRWQWDLSDLVLIDSVAP